MTRALLLDAVPADLEVRDGDTLITLSATAELECRRRGLDHRPLEDIASQEDLSAAELAYWADQVRWLADLEAALICASPELAASGLQPVMPAAYALKLLFDNVYIRGFECDRLTHGPWTEFVHHTRRDGPPLLSQLLPEFCAARDVRYTPVHGVTGGARPERRSLRSLRSRCATILREPFQETVDRVRRVEQDGMTLLALSHGYDLGEVIRRNRRAGGRSLLVAEGLIVDVTGPIPKRVLRLSSPDPESVTRWQTVAARIRDDASLCAWPASWFDGLAADAAMNRLWDWIPGTMPTILRQAPAFQRVLEAEGVGLVAAPFLIDATQAAAFSAARASRSAKTVIVEHGDTAFDAPSWDLNLLAADAFVVPTREVAEYFEGRDHAYPGTTASLHVGSYRWPAAARLQTQHGGHVHRVGLAAAAPRRRLRQPGAVRRPLLVYLVTALAGDSRYMNNAFFDDAWYFGLQASIVDTLASQDRFDVVVKLFPGDGHDLNPLAEYVAGLGVRHVRVSRSPFSGWLPTADRVLADFPSTGFFEALLAGVPSLSLLWRHHRHRRAIIDRLAGSTAPFGTADEAAAAVRAFVESDETSSARLAPEGDDLLSVLRAVAAAP